MPSFEILILVLGLILVGSLIGSLLAFVLRLRDLFRHDAPLPSKRGAKRGPPIFVDGSNVMHWGGDGPSEVPLRLVLSKLQENGFSPVVWFDANVGYKLQNRHMGPRELARMLPVRAEMIHLAPSGQPADPLVIEAALAEKARLVSNDRFMDWRAQYPGLRAKGVLVKGSVKGTKVELTL
ncbi:NYN domain-containing protein [Flavimaricola marinus]|uniref:Zc3h12a-like Ribonuclease NYN domain protein n=1 Tax=Flavimaricola marinus TaxID=1819565 RepID=A0A238LHD1_9RHOB|nr:hypothetical protein [Flavimaricola marinus]SMY08366.1 Zc3h12a-like Ribonuclease NYN domain protein [Flavimaricola marinus]